MQLLQLLSYLQDCATFLEYALLELYDLLLQQEETLLDLGHIYNTRGYEQCEEWTACGDKNRRGAHQCLVLKCFFQIVLFFYNGHFNGSSDSTALSHKLATDLGLVYRAMCLFTSLSCSWYKVYCLRTEATACKQLAQGCYPATRQRLKLATLRSQAKSFHH